GHAWILNPRKKSFLHQGVAVTDTTSLNFDSHGFRGRFRDWAFHELEGTLPASDLNDTHSCHFDLHSFSKVLWQRNWKNETSLLVGLQNGCEGAMWRSAQYGLLTLVEIGQEMMAALRRLPSGSGSLQRAAFFYRPGARRQPGEDGGEQNQ